MLYRQAVPHFYHIFKQVSKKNTQGSFRPSLVKIHTIKKLIDDTKCMVTDHNSYYAQVRLQVTPEI